MRQMKKVIPLVTISLILISVSSNAVYAETIPEWVKNNALWYGQGIVSEDEFINAIKFLIENGVIVIETSEKMVTKVTDAMITIPNGNFDVTGAGFYSPLNMEISTGTTVTWVNDDSVPHNIQSQDEKGKVIALFNSPPLNTGDKFKFTFEEAGVYTYHCTFHPWRVGVVTVK